ncbi:hypothetical protein K439DRAFT_1271508, partial [Ramaria rubella]
TSISSVPPTRKEKAIWTPEDERALICLLINHKAEAGEGGNFDKTTWVAVLKAMMDHFFSGGIKSLEACKTRWVKVCT